MKNVLKAKAISRIAGIAVIMAVIAFAMAACDDDNGPNGGYNPNPGSNVPVTGVTLNQNSLTLSVGGPATLAATVSPGNATNKAVTWKSSNTSIASVNNNGTVTAVAAGSATITVTTADGGKTAACSVTVTSGSGGNPNPGGVPTFTNVADMIAWLKPQPARDVIYTVKLNVSSLGGDSSTPGSVGQALTFWSIDQNVNLDLSGSTITSIGKNAFNSCERLVGVTIPNSVTSIEDGAFWNSNITSVIIPNSVRSIEDNAFGYCFNLASVTIGNSVTTIGAWAFHADDKLTSVTIPASVTSIENNAFYHMKLSSVTFLRADTTLNNAFGGSNLETAYKAGGAGTYTRSGDDTWTKR